MASEGTTTPVLRLRGGPDTGRIYPLSGECTTLGRAAACDVVLGHRAVSKRHAAVERRGDGYVLRDLDSRAGTRLDGRLIDRPRPLLEGDVIRICDYELVFTYLPVEFRDDDTDSTILVSVDAASSHTPGPDDGRAGRQLKAVLDVGRALSGAADLDALLRATLGALFATFPQAERGFVLLRSESGAGWAGGLARDRHPDGGRLAASRTILRRVVESAQAVLCRDAAAENPESHSLASMAVRSLICAPLLDRHGRPIGVIQLDARDEKSRFEPADLDLLTAVAAQVGLAVQNARLQEALRRRGEVEQELLWARRVLEALMGPRRGGPAGYAVWECYEPAHHVGGDYVGGFPLPRPDDPPGGPGRRWAFAIGDVSGKGMPAALLAAHLAAEVGPALAEEPDPGRVVARLNRRICDAGLDDMFVTFLLIVVDAAEHRLEVVNAGHMAPLVRRAGGLLETVGREGAAFPLGYDPREIYHAERTTLGPGDVGVLYTDGITEAANPAGAGFGTEALRRVLETTVGGPAAVGAAILKAVRRHADGRDPSDDLTLLCFGPAG